MPSDDLANAPVGMPYQQYWDDGGRHEGLIAQVAEAIEWARDRDEANKDRRLAEHIVDRVFARVKLVQWCAKPGCLDEWCESTHYSFDISTKPRRFAEEVPS
jgi:hypothetical protein